MTGNKPKFPDIEVEFDLAKPEGNAFNILGTVMREMRLAGIGNEERKRFVAEATTGNYQNVLNTVGRWVNATFHNRTGEKDG